MKILFIHQNFPAQYRRIIPGLRNQGYKLRAISQRNLLVISGVPNTCYSLSSGNLSGQHPYLINLESATLRAQSVADICQKWKSMGYTPDIVMAHTGWGESLFIKDVWPDVKVAGYFEYFYHEYGAELNFDEEFPPPENIAYKLRMRNAHLLSSLESCDIGITPTKWQHSRFPKSLSGKIKVIHEGIDTTNVSPLPDAWVRIRNGLVFRPGDEVITFVNRNFEPTRGYHQFMRVLPELLKERPNAHVILVGGDGCSYGRRPEGSLSYKQLYLDEVKAFVDMSRVHFVGKVPFEVYLKLLQISAVHVYLTYPFILSWSLLEAMSAGCAVVASRTSPVQEVINHNENGLLVDFFSARELVESVCMLLDESQARLQIGKQARLDAIENFDFNAVCKKKIINALNL